MCNHAFFTTFQTTENDIQISVRDPGLMSEDVQVDIHPDIGNEVEISNTDHARAAQLTDRIKNGKILSSHPCQNTMNNPYICILIRYCQTFMLEIFQYLLGMLFHRFH